MRKNYKPMIIGILCALIVVMAVGFALLREQLTITGTSHIDSNWNIRITNIRVKSLNSAYSTGDNASKDNDETVVGDCTTKTVKNGPCDSTTANFDAKLVTPGDSITYEVTITNSGNLDGVVESIDLECTDNEAIQCTTSGLSRADTIVKTNGTNTIDVTVTYNSATSSQPASTTSNITLTINYQQNLGQIQSQSNSGYPEATPFANGTGTIYRYGYQTGWGDAWGLAIGDSIEDKMEDEDYGITTSPSDFNSNVYLRHDVVNYEITSSYVCFVANDTEYCLRGGNSSDYETNVGILNGIQGFTCEEESFGFACSGLNFYDVSVNFANGDVVANSESQVQCEVSVGDEVIYSKCESY